MAAMIGATGRAVYQWCTGGQRKNCLCALLCNAGNRLDIQRKLRMSPIAIFKSLFTAIVHVSVAVFADAGRRTFHRHILPEYGGTAWCGVVASRWRFPVKPVAGAMAGIRCRSSTGLKRHRVRKTSGKAEDS